MSKELYFTDGNNEVKYLDTTASFNLAITQDGSAFDLTNATAIDVKVANDTGYVFDKSIDMTTITQPLAGSITMPVDAEVMNALVPDDYTIEVWVTLSSLITPGSQEGLTDDGSTTATTTDSTTYNAIFPSDDPQGFSITDNVMSDSGDVIPVMSLDEFQQEFNQLKTDLTSQVSTLQGPAGKDGENGKDGATGPQGPQGIQGPKGDTGQGLEIKGKVDTTSQLPATASEGDGYLVAEELYVWTDNEWKDCGQIQGPAGKDGATVDETVAGVLKSGDVVAGSTYSADRAADKTAADSYADSAATGAMNQANGYVDTRIADLDWQKTPITATNGSLEYELSQADNVDMYAKMLSLPLGFHTMYVQAGVKNNPVNSPLRGYFHVTNYANNTVSIGYGHFTSSSGLSFDIYYDGTWKILKLADKAGVTVQDLPNGTDLALMVNNTGLVQHYRASSNAISATMKNAPTKSAFFLTSMPVNPVNGIGTNGYPDWAYTLLTIRESNTGIVWTTALTTGASTVPSNNGWKQIDTGRITSLDGSNTLNTATSNLDNYIRAGKYEFGGAVSWTNGPTPMNGGSYWGVLEVITNDSTNVRFQKIYNNNSQIFFRQRSGVPAGWTGWRQVGLTVV